MDTVHGAARDGRLEVLQGANRKELNARDADGMTPAMCAAYHGQLDALRLIVGRGGDPDKSDGYGNTPLHCSSGRGHLDSVSFLVAFGVNLWALDNDFRTAKDVAVLNQREDVLRLLDQAESRHAVVNRKLVQRLKEKSVYDAERRVKSYRKRQQKAAKRADNSRAAPQRFSELVNGGRVKKSVVFALDEDSSLEDSGIGEEGPEGGIFERPGFGTVAFRTPLIKAAFEEVEAQRLTDSIGSAGSLRRHIRWEDEATSEEEEEEEDEEEEDHLPLLLSALGLGEWEGAFRAERIDLEALSLLSEGDLRALDMPLGPRRKLERALRERDRVIRDPGDLVDSPL